jgi:hypothetical protein
MNQNLSVRVCLFPFAYANIYRSMLWRSVPFGGHQAKEMTNALPALVVVSLGGVGTHGLGHEGGRVGQKSLQIDALEVS